VSTIQSKQIPALSNAEAQRFWSDVQKDGNDRGCWLWGGNHTNKGYGRFVIGGRAFYAHRVSWALAGRSVPTNLQICHTCDNRGCVNPDHLMMADNATNQRDAKLKRNLDGRHAAIKKPHKDFPLFPHATRRWAKKIRGKLYYFGSTVSDPSGDEALKKYLDQKDDLHAGRRPRLPGDGLTVRDLVNRFLTTKKRALEAGELSMPSWADYYAACERLVKVFDAGRLVEDLRPEDFEKLRVGFAKSWGLVRIGNEVNRVRIIFNYAFKNGLIDKPVLFGEFFKRPNRRTIRKDRAAKGLRMFEAAELRAMLKAANMPLKAMLLLGANCGFGNNDCGMLPKGALDLGQGWVNFPRPKTGIERRCPLWPETVQALREWLAMRPEPAKQEHAELVFLTARGGSWAKQGYFDDNGKPKNISDNPISKETAKLLKELEINGHRSFYALRHTLETIGGEAKDQVAVDSIMGHAREDMATVYRERVSDERLKAVTDHVRAWLFGPAKKQPSRSRKQK
jgi:integrase